MTDQAKPSRSPASDLAAFDVSQQSPEQIAVAFVRWKEQRKGRVKGGSTRVRPPARAAAVAAQSDSPPALKKTVRAKRVHAKRARPIRYSTSFSALLEAGSEPSVARDAWAPVPRLPLPEPPLETSNRLPERRLKMMSALAGAASVLVLAGGVLLERWDWQNSVAAETERQQVYIEDVPIAGAAVTAPAVHSTLQQTIDLTLMKAAPPPAPAKPSSEPPAPSVQTASKPTGAHDSPKPKLAPVAKPFVPSSAAATAPVSNQIVPVAKAVRTSDPRPDALIQRGHQNSADPMAPSGSKAAGAIGLGGPTQ